jgi:hypothetical protein
MTNGVVTRERTGETVALTLIAFVTLYWVVQMFRVWDISGGYFGWNLGSDGRTIVYVTPGAPAARAGIRPGDRVDWATLPLLGRSNLVLVQSTALDAQLTVSVERGGVQRTVTMHAVPWSPVVQDEARLGLIAQVILIGMGIALVRFRPSRMTWGFLFAWLGTSHAQTLIWAENDPVRFFARNGFSAALYGASAAGLLIFISRFPRNESRGPLVFLDRTAIPFGAAVTVMWLVLDALILFSPVSPPQWLLLILIDALWPAIGAVAILSLIVALHQTTSSDRQRILPVLVAVGLLTLSMAAFQLYRALATAGMLFGIVRSSYAVAELLLAAAVAHGIIRYRVLDLSFAISRTVVYTMITTMIVATLALIDFASSKFLERLQLTFVLEAGAALAFGMGMNTIHARIDRFVDSVLFRRRHLADQRLRRASRTLTHAESGRFIDEALVVEAADALDLASAAVFRREEDRFVRILDRGWKSSDAGSLSQDDQIVVNLSAELQTIDLLTLGWTRADVPEGIDRPILAVPLVVRHELLGFVLYGGHIGGEAIDPDEKKTLGTLAYAAASAYDHIRATALVAESERLRSEIAILSREQRLLREIIDNFARHGSSAT